MFFVVGVGLGLFWWWDVWCGGCLCSGFGEFCYGF